MDAPTVGRPMGARCATYTLHRVSARHLLSYRHPESRVCSLRARENPFTQPSPSFRGVTPTVCGLRRAYVCVGCACVCVCVRVCAFLRLSARSLARSFIRATAMRARSSTSLGAFVLFANPLLRSCGRALHLHLLAPAIRPSRSLSREEERARERTTRTCPPRGEALIPLPPQPLHRSCPSSSGASTHPTRTHLGRSHTSLRLIAPDCKETRRRA